LEGSSTTTIEGKLEVSKDFEIKGSSTLLIQKSGELIVKGNTEHKSSTPIRLEGTATLAGKLELSGNSTLQVNGNMLVLGNTTIEGSSSVRIQGYATFEKEVNLEGGGTHLHVSGSGDVLIKGDLEKKTSATISVLDKSSLVICNDRVNGDKVGAFPPTTFSNMNIGAAPAYYGGCRILPVEFPVFNVALNQNFREINVRWATAKEWNNSHFIIERAVDQVKNWEPVGEILGAGYSDQILNYSFIDKNLPASGGQLFYRIRQVDFDGKSTIGNTKAVNVQPVSGKGTWTAYPNPSQKGTYIHIELLNKVNFNEETIAVQVSNITGTAHENFLIKNPADVEKVVNDFIAAKNAGLYLLNIRWGEFSETIKILVQ
jgi:cytoskeletal protein CcmA (bactofilin family)